MKGDVRYARIDAECPVCFQQRNVMDVGVTRYEGDRVLVVCFYCNTCKTESIRLNTLEQLRDLVDRAFPSKKPTFIHEGNDTVN